MAGLIRLLPSSIKFPTSESKGVRPVEPGLEASFGDGTSPVPLPRLVSGNLARCLKPDEVSCLVPVATQLTDTSGIDEGSCSSAVGNVAYVRIGKEPSPREIGTNLRETCAITTPRMTRRQWMLYSAEQSLKDVANIRRIRRV